MAKSRAIVAYFQRGSAPGGSNKLCTSIVILTFTSLCRNVHIMAGIFSLDNTRENPFTCLGIRWLPTRKRSACWDMGGSSHLTWVTSDIICRSGPPPLHTHTFWGTPTLHKEGNVACLLKCSVIYPQTS